MLENLILRQVVSLIRDPVIVVDAQGRVIYSNEAHRRISGWAADEIVGVSHSLVFQAPPSAENQLSQPTEDTGTLYKRDGSKLTMSVTCAPLQHPEDEGSYAGLVAIFHPELLGSDDRRNHAAASSDDFVSTVSHELRTPLTSIKGFAETLLHRFENISPTDRHRFLGIIKDRADHVSRLVEDLLLVSRIHNQGVHMVLRPLELKPQLDKTCEALSNQIGGRLISYDIPANLPKVRADSDRCEQIFTNLLSNAIKYSPADGRIELRAGIDPDDPSKVRVYVSDSGPGIPEEQQQLLFRRFGRVDNPLVRNTHGAGLGLFISKSLAEAQGGDIWLASSDSQGTTFAFNLPIAGTSV